FAPQLGAQRAVWVRDGVHVARLQLNPADMGPVRVEIQLDGSAAQVSLSAANDQTRQALQDALPGLAGSLREAGFTLAGGGVFDQPPQQRDNDGRKAGDGRLGAAGSDSSSTAGAVAQPLLPRRRGLVDLVA
ncbi:MAG: flagellar hook-length control protein FliK, partial [Burkholderiales bacterium]